jgi:hypothetical protein
MSFELFFHARLKDEFAENKGPESKILSGVAVVLFDRVEKVFPYQNWLLERGLPPYPLILLRNLARPCPFHQGIL